MCVRKRGQQRAADDVEPADEEQDQRADADAERRQPDFERDRLAVTEHVVGADAADLRRPHDAVGIECAREALAVDARDDVAGQHAGAIGCATRRDLYDQHRLVDRAERVDQRRRRQDDREDLALAGAEHQDLDSRLALDTRARFRTAAYGLTVDGDEHVAGRDGVGSVGLPRHERRLRLEHPRRARPPLHVLDDVEVRERIDEQVLVGRGASDDEEVHDREHGQPQPERSHGCAQQGTRATGRRRRHQWRVRAVTALPAVRGAAGRREGHRASPGHPSRRSAGLGRRSRTPPRGSRP